jgi:tetratricopeptide (TPR) repeat protein
MAGFAKRGANDAEGLFERAREFEEAGNRPAAIAAIEELCRCCPTNAEGWVWLSYLLNTIGEYRRALDAASEALRHDQDNLAGLVNAGIAAFGLGDLHTARVHLERAVHLDPLHANAQYRLGRTLAALQETAGAIEAFVRAIGEAPSAPHSVQWIIEQAVAGFAAIEPAQPPNSLLGSLHEGARWLAASKLVRAYRCLERARDGPCGLEVGVSATREAARTLLGEVWRSRARMTPTPNDAEQSPAPLIRLYP